jgi:epoxyqueuosine reductase
VTGAELAEAVRREAGGLGFGLVGITAPEPTEHMRFYRAWLAAGHHGVMAYLARRDAVARRADLERTMEGVRSVVVVGHEYDQPDPPGVPEDPSRGVIARYARGGDYHKVIKKKLRALARAIDGLAGGGVTARAYVDTGPILERDLARRAGLGWFGKNTMIIHPGKGSYFFLGVLLLDIDLPVDSPFEADRCGTCTACVEACPTGALLGRDESGAPVMDATLCISYLTIEHRGPIPVGLRARLSNRVFGCDICQEVCPWNERFSEVAEERAYAARGPAEGEHLTEGGKVLDASMSFPGTDGPRLVDLLRMDRATWNAFAQGSALRRAGYGGLRRNAAIALGNWLAHTGRQEPEAVQALSEVRSDEDPVVAECAAWALGQTSGGR